MQPELASDPLTEFFQAIRAPKTRRYYEKRLAQFLDYAGARGNTLAEKARDFKERSRKDDHLENTTFVITQFLMEQKARVEAGEITAGTLTIYSKPLRLFCEMNDITINWKKIYRKLPQGRQYADDRAPTRDEIARLIAYPDRRIRPVVLVMASSGIRIGAWETMDWGHVTPIERGGKVVAAKLKVYPGDREQYEAFITPEAYGAVKEYIDYRASAGEKIGPNSPLIRNLFHPDRGAYTGEPHMPRRLNVGGVKRLIEDALFGTGLRKPLTKEDRAAGKRRHEFQGAHGFRKFAKTAMERHMKTLHAEILLNHGTGLNRNYYRPKEEDLLDDYLKAIPELTILERPAPSPVDEDRIRRLEAALEEERAVNAARALALDSKLETLEGEIRALRELRKKELENRGRRD